MAREPFDWLKASHSSRRQSLRLTSRAVRVGWLDAPELQARRDALLRVLAELVEDETTSDSLIVGIMQVYGTIEEKKLRALKALRREIARIRRRCP
jgi:hypothetical protein